MGDYIPFSFGTHLDGEGASVIRADGRRWQGALLERGGRPLIPPPIPRLGAMPAPAPEAEPEAPPPPMVSEEALERAVAEARAEGEAAGRAEAMQSQAARQADVLDRVAETLQSIQVRHQQALATRAGASRELALALAGAIVPRAMAVAPLADVEAMLTDLVGRLEDEPGLELALAPDLVAAGRDRLEEVARRVGFKGGIDVHGDPDLAPGDARLAWRRGEAVRDLEQLRREAEAIVDAWLPESTAGVQPEITDPTSEQGSEELD